MLIYSYVNLRHSDVIYLGWFKLLCHQQSKNEQHHGPPAKSSVTSQWATQFCSFFLDHTSIWHQWEKAVESGPISLLNLKERSTIVDRLRNKRDGSSCVVSQEQRPLLSTSLSSGWTSTWERSGIGSQRSQVCKVLVWWIWYLLSYEG